MEHIFMLYASAKESLNAKSFMINMQETLFSYHGIFLYRRLTVRLSTNSVPSPLGIRYDH